MTHGVCSSRKSHHEESEIVLGSYGNITSGMQGSNGDSAPGRAPLTSEPDLNPSPERLIGSSKGEGRGTGVSAGPPTTEQMVRDMSPDFNIKYGNRVPEEEARGKKNVWELSVIL